MSAFRRASESYTLFRQLGQPYTARWPYGFAALALALVGQADRAAETLAVHDALDRPSTAAERDRHPSGPGLDRGSRR